MECNHFNGLVNVLCWHENRHFFSLVHSVREFFCGGSQGQGEVSCRDSDEAQCRRVCCVWLSEQVCLSCTLHSLHSLGFVPEVEVFELGQGGLGTKNAVYAKSPL